MMYKIVIWQFIQINCIIIQTTFYLFKYMHADIRLTIRLYKNRK